MSRTQLFRTGVATLKEGFSFFLKHPKLWGYAVIPFVLAVLLFALLFGLFVDTFGAIYEWLLVFVGPLDIVNPTNIWLKMADGILWVLDQLLKLFLFLIGIILLSLTSYVAQMILAGPFNDLLSEKTEVLVTDEAPLPFHWKTFWKGILQTIRAELFKAALFLTIPLVLLVLNLIPVAGGFLYTILLTLFGLWQIGFSCTDYPMSRKLVPIRARLQFARKNKYALIGFGLLFFIPFAPLFLQAPLVVGGTLLHRKLTMEHP